MKRIYSLLSVLLIALLPSLVWAGSEQANNPTLPAAKVAAFSNGLQKTLAARGAHVAIVGRVGRDRSDLPDGIEYTHVAYWIYSKMQRADGTTFKGYRVYNLYQQADDESVSRLVQDSPADFFAGVYELDAGVIIPDARLQKKLLSVIASPMYSDLHNARYSVLANPNTTEFQNCTEHTLDVLMAGLYATSNKAQIKSNIQAHFDPQFIKLGAAKRFFAPAASSALTTRDHGPQVRTATFGTILDFMQDNGLDQEAFRFEPNNIQPLR